MKVIIYDYKNFPGFWQWWLKATWAVGSRIMQLLFGYKVIPVSSWEDTLDKLAPLGELEEVQFWGHGSPATIYMGGVPVRSHQLKQLASHMRKDGLVWLRACSTIKGIVGIAYAKEMADALGCRFAGHTRIIGVFQGGLHSLRPGQEPKWSPAEGELDGGLSKLGLTWGNNTVFCLARSFPQEW